MWQSDRRPPPSPITESLGQVTSGRCLGRDEGMHPSFVPKLERSTGDYAATSDAQVVPPAHLNSFSRPHQQLLLRGFDPHDSNESWSTIYTPVSSPFLAIFTYSTSHVLAYIPTAVYLVPLRLCTSSDSTALVQPCYPFPCTSSPSDESIQQRRNSSLDNLKAPVHQSVDAEALPYPRTRTVASTEGKQTLVKDGDGATLEMKNHGRAGHIQDQFAGEHLSQEERDWPSGNQVREHSADAEDDGRWRDSKWAWRSIGNQTHDGYLARVSRCLGVLQCSDCGFLIRPKTDANARRGQKREGCQSPKCHNRKMHWIDCKARIYHYHEAREHEGQSFHVWEHSGEHKHARPPGGHLTQAEEKAIDQIVSRQPHASAHELRTGDTMPGSVPLSKLVPSLASPRRARYRVEQSKSRLGVHSISAKGAFAALCALTELNNKLNAIVESSFSGPTYCIICTPFMKLVTKEAVHDWLTQSSMGGPSSGRHGFITDGDHSFFRTGTLLTTCAFSGVLNAWVPVLYTWVNRIDAAHHRPHFRHLNRIICEAAGANFERKLLFAIMDFSAAQIKAHQEEYVETMITRIEGWNSLTEGAKVLQRTRLFEEAQFDAAVTELRATFANIKAWIDWWIRPAVASMIFPAKSKISPEHAAEIPLTSNAVETQHSLLHHATGTGQDLVVGIECLVLHVEEMEQHYSSILAGEVKAETRLASARPSTRVTFADNDGRAPDTAAILHAAQAAKGTRYKQSRNTTKTKTKPTTQIVPGASVVPSPGPTQAFTERELMSYPWEDNSCYIDNLLDMFFRSYGLLPQEARRQHLSALEATNPDSPLTLLYQHYQTRLEWICAGSDDNGEGVSILESGRSIICDVINNVWKLYEKPDAMGCTVTWFNRLVRTIDDTNIRLFFGPQHFLIFRCSIGHESVEAACQPLADAISLLPYDIMLTRMQLEQDNIDLADYFSHAIPRRPIGKHAHGTTMLHTSHERQCGQCLEEGHSGSSMVLKIIRTAWPQTLRILPETHADTPETYAHRDPVKFPLSWSIKGLRSLGDQSTDVTYLLVGRVLYRNRHFTAQMRLSNSAFLYDSVKNGGRLTSIGDDAMLQQPTSEVSLALYHRVLGAYVTEHCVSDIHDLYERWRKSHPPSPVISISDSYTDSAKFSSSGALPGSVVRTPTPQPAVATKKQARKVTGPTTKRLPVKPPTKGRRQIRSSEMHMIRCAGCGLESTVSALDDCEADTIECDECSYWHHIPCIEAQYGLPSSVSHWACPRCADDVLKPLWKDDYLGQHVLLETVNGGALYPAKLVKREGLNVQLDWYYGNIYSPASEKPKFSVLPIYQIAQALDDQSGYAYLERKLGKIRWPARLGEEDADSDGYRNPALTDILDDAFHSIYQIVSGDRDHPVIRRFLDMSVAGGNKLSETSLWYTAHDIPILPGDQDLLQPYLMELEARLRKDGSSHKLDSTTLVFGPAHLLLSLVVLRTYLDCKPENDEEIYRIVVEIADSRKEQEHTSIVVEVLASKQLQVQLDDPEEDCKLSIVRNLSVPEQALAALDGQEDTTDPGHIHLALMHSDQLRPTAKLDARFDGPIATVLRGPQPYTWGTRQDQATSADYKLTGGPKFERTPRHTRDLRSTARASGDPQQRKRPRPRPLKRTRGSNLQNVVALHNEPEPKEEAAATEERVEESPRQQPVEVSQVHKGPGRQQRKRRKKY
ncbi:hypothetical protein CERSUDRAFT_122698 [Gelatoporia subvermispora B]|uniref:PHD-type domain-containing protein n=1 Tax=Ceriporiopsis subvermispora (strain B) TaxID=914234 RepID=M2RLD2_CERS8|nr:hypothetical protein CERSUDRAFT_122698 [Gelatoporia subvermispora B]